MGRERPVVTVSETQFMLVAGPCSVESRKQLLTTTKAFKAAVAAGAGGLMIKVHPNPEEAFSDGAQSLLPDEFAALTRELKQYLKLEGRTL